MVHLDTMIGFALVMLLLSLLVTVAVQIVFFLLDLRGKELLWGLAVALEEAGIGNARRVRP